jgi:hypothetical protein
MDKTPPRNQLIALYSALAVVTLFALKPAFDSYFDQMLQDASGRSLEIGRDTADLDQARARWTEREPYIVAAMEKLSRQGRITNAQLRPVQPEGVNPAERHWNIMPEDQLPQVPQRPAPVVAPPAPVAPEAAPAEAAPAEAPAAEAAAPAQPEEAAAPTPAAPAAVDAPPARPVPAPARRPRPARPAAEGGSDAPAPPAAAE